MDKERAMGLGSKNHPFPTAAIVRAAAVAALYVGFSLLFSSISYGVIQFRIAECLTILPFFFPETIFGLFFGCLISNFFSPLILPLDVTIGTTATLIAAYLTSRVKQKWIAPLPPVLVNAFAVPIILCLSTPEQAFLPTYLTGFITVAIGEIAVCYGLGMPLIYAVEKLPFPLSGRKGRPKKS